MSVAFEECKAHFRNGSSPRIFMTWLKQQDLGKDHDDWDWGEGDPLMMEDESISGSMWSYKESEYAGKTLLHWVLDYYEKGPVNGDIVAAVIEASRADYRAAIERPDSWHPGNLPLHTACITARRYCKNSGMGAKPMCDCDNDYIAVHCNTCGKDNCENCDATVHAKGSQKKHTRIPIEEYLSSKRGNSEQRRQREQQRRNVQNANANVMKVFAAYPAAALVQNHQYWKYHPKEITGYYPVQYMFSCMPESPSGFAEEDLRTILNEMGQGATKKMMKEKNRLTGDAFVDDDATPTLEHLGSIGSHGFNGYCAESTSLLEFATFRHDGYAGYKSSDAEVRIVLEAWPGAAYLKSKEMDKSFLSRVLECHCAVVPRLLALHPGLATGTTPQEYAECDVDDMFPDDATLAMGGYTPLHLHVFHSRYQYKEPAKTRKDHMLNSDICYQFVAAGTALEAKSSTNNRYLGCPPHETALEMALERILTKQEDNYKYTGYSGPYYDEVGQSDPSNNDHVYYTLAELTAFSKAKTKGGRRLGNDHFRHWTTRSHGWCPPTAQLTAMTVLLVGETYTRGLLPRLPMDCWYRILNMLPRHELRIGQCTPEEEEAAQEEYDGIVQAAQMQEVAPALPLRLSKPALKSMRNAGAPQSKPATNTSTMEGALSYLDEVKYQCQNTPEVYTKFMDIMIEFKSANIDTPGVIKRVAELFEGHPQLMVGFDTFLPPGFAIKVGSGQVIITENSGDGTTTTREHKIVLRVGANHVQGEQQQQQQQQAADPASTNSPPTPEHNHAIQYVDKIKRRFEKNPQVYKDFLEILHTYQKEHKSIGAVYHEAAKLFKRQPDLLAEFAQFLPEAAPEHKQAIRQQHKKPASPRGSVDKEAGKSRRRTSLRIYGTGI